LKGYLISDTGTARACGARLIDGIWWQMREAHLPPDTIYPLRGGAAPDMESAQARTRERKE